jgi:predicted nucleic acid-binding protein
MLRSCARQSASASGRSTNALKSVVLLDTSVLVDVLRGSQPAVEWLSALGEVPACSELTRTEVLRGVRSPERSRTERLLSSLRWIAVDEPISRRGGELGRRYRRSHPGLSIVDFLIAATAELLDAELATANVRHYPMFAELTPPYVP